MILAGLRILSDDLRNKIKKSDKEIFSSAHIFT